MSKSNEKRRGRKRAAIDRPPKPYPDFPLCPANIGRWQKKIPRQAPVLRPLGQGRKRQDDAHRTGRLLAGRVGRVRANPRALYAGREPKVPGEGTRRAELCNIRRRKFVPCSTAPRVRRAAAHVPHGGRRNQGFPGHTARDGAQRREHRRRVSRARGRRPARGRGGARSGLVVRDRGRCRAKGAFSKIMTEQVDGKYTSRLVEQEGPEAWSGEVLREAGEGVSGPRSPLTRSGIGTKAINLRGRMPRRLRQDALPDSLTSSGKNSSSRRTKNPYNRLRDTTVHPAVKDASTSAEGTPSASQPRFW